MATGTGHKSALSPKDDPETTKPSLFCCCCRKEKSSARSSHRAKTTATTEVKGVQAIEKAADVLPLRNKKEREQVQRALEEEMKRRRTHRQVLKQRRCAEQFAAGPAGKGEFVPLLPRERFEDDREEDAAPIMSPGEEAYYAALMEASASGSGSAKNASLDDQRQEWIRKMQTQGSSAQPQKPGRTTDDQPDTLTLDTEAAEEIASHTLAHMLRRVLMQAMIAEETEKEKAKRKKSPAEMTPDELIELRTRDPESWDAFVAANSVSSFGLAKPTSEDQAKANKLLAKSQGKRGGGRRSMDGSFSNSASEDSHHRAQKQRPVRGRVHFDPQIDVVSLPIGEDFYEDEHKTYKTIPLCKLGDNVPPRGSRCQGATMVK